MLLNFTSEGAPSIGPVPKFGHIGWPTEGIPPVLPSPAGPLVGPYKACGRWVPCLWS